MTSELNFKPAHELAGLIRSKQLSPVECGGCLDRIEERWTLNAWWAVAEVRGGGRAIEGGLRRRMWAAGGVPFGVKELEPSGSRARMLEAVQGQLADETGGGERLRGWGRSRWEDDVAGVWYSATRRTCSPRPRNRGPGAHPRGSSGGSRRAVSSGQVPFARGPKRRLDTHPGLLDGCSG